MAVSGKKIVYDFNRKFDSVLNARNRKLPLVAIIAYINEAQDIWFRAATKVAETDKQAREDLRLLEIKRVSLPLIQRDDYTVAVYPENMFTKLNQLVKACKPDCCGDLVKEFTPQMNQADDLNESFKLTNNQADFAWEQLPADEGSEGLYLFHYKSMDIKEVIIDYYRKPQQIHTPSLVVCEGPRYYDYAGTVISQDQDFEIDCRYLDNKIADIAVLLAKRDIGELTDFNVRLQALLQLDNILKV